MSWRILVVDDQEQVRRALERALSRAGHIVVTAGSGEEAAELLADGLAPDMVFMDLRMPTMSGRTLYQVMLAQWPDLVRQLCVMSGDPDADDHAAWLALHEIPVLAKPFDLRDVYAMVDLLAPRGRREVNGHGS